MEPGSSAAPSSSSETNKKRNYRRSKNKKPDASSSSSAEDTTTKKKGNSNDTKQQKQQPQKKNVEKKSTLKKPSKKKEDDKKQVKVPLKGFKKVVKEEEEEEDEDAEGCFICARPIDYYAVAPCDHRTCHLCTLRLRVLYNTKNCAYCKAEAKKVVFTTDSEKSYEAYTREDTPFYDSKYGIRFETEAMYKDTMVLLQYNCPQDDCEEAFENWGELKRHVKTCHQRSCCDLCIRHKKIFAHEHTLYTNEQLQKHRLVGDASFNKEDETGFTGHPECVFCQTRFYGADELFEHCRDKHEQCHLCVRKGIQSQYYANYDNLEKHFKKEHYLCQYKECLDNKFVVFDSDIDLKAHEVDEHGNGISRQQRAKQSEARRVDVNINYAQQRNNTRPSNSRRPPLNLSAEDFPDINGSSSPSSSSFLSNRMGSLQLSQQEQWPTLGEDPNNSGRSSPANESDSSMVSRHAAALDRIANTLQSFEKIVKFRQLTNAFTSLSSDSETYVNGVYELCHEDADMTAKVLNAAKDLVDNRALKNEMVRTWNQKKNPSSSSSSPAIESPPRVLVVKSPPTSQGRRPIPGQKKKAGVWDKVASAAVDAGAVTPPLHYGVQQTRTPWSGTTSQQSVDLEPLFPALPTSAGPSSRRADINAMIKKNNTNAWGESSHNNALESDYFDEDTSNRKKKGKKGKQVLFRVGL
ncbi:uncharacterized protein EV154DRAFT_556287 [Mucor mucedo]|uniref:uncharacterized protein n=1 Tax=Mucor mucedo TaxID=29922 RepID=UPI00221ECEC1|nr:uncharacterized protein EV154DRAFT_556287 [Mucor mucedo]KAI7873291.1 hypothetical protein EV154DRAFT_556287 [Mucor mucedo]